MVKQFSRKFVPFFFNSSRFPPSPNYKWTLRFWNIYLSNLSGLLTDDSCDFVPFAQFKKREKNPYRSVTFSKDATWKMRLKITVVHGYFSHFLICINGTKLHQASYIYQIIFQELIIKCWWSNVVLL